MDAHTLNAWTRFALQKGGIGTCTALVDNPATDAEDLMFMTGEKIIVLRRLDGDDPKASESSTDSAASSSRKQSNNDADAWFLGYCEGVVGKFRGVHVQIHGKLKKPVLMRRSGQAQIRESTTKIMPPAVAAAMPASQVPVGIPVSAVTVDSEGAHQGDDSFSSSRNSEDSQEDWQPATDAVTPQASSVSKFGQTQPLPQASRHQREISTSTTDSDNSETVLPWARRESTVSSTSTRNSLPQVASKAHPQVTAFSTSHSNSHMSEPSPVESRESETSSARGHGIPHSPSVASVLSSATESSDDEGSNNRVDHTLSIYDIYGRDSVAFPNFDLRGITASDTAASIKVESDKHPTPPLAPEHIRANMRDLRVSPAQDVAAKLRSSPSGRRPNAAPDPRLPTHHGAGVLQTRPALASTLRNQVEASSPRSEIPPSLPAPNPQQAPAVVRPPPPQPLRVNSNYSSSSAPNSPNVGIDPNFDPRRRPSALGSGMPAPAPHQRPQPPPLHIPRPGQPVSGAMHSPGHRPISPMGPPQGIPRPGQAMPSGFGPGSFITAAQQDDRRGSGASSLSGAAPSPTNLAFPPNVVKRASSEKSPAARGEKVGSGQLRKNPSSPSPGMYGGQGNGAGMRGSDALSPVQRSATANTGSTSPLGVSPEASSSSRLASPVGPDPMRRSASPSGSMGARSTRSSIPRNYDAKGFVIGRGQPCVPETDAGDAVQKWRSVLSENDLAGARKSRKVKKMVQQGIPNSMRGQVWLFLSNSSVRRRVGLFEQLCGTSQSVKGKKGREEVYANIEKDVGRSFPDNMAFQDGSPAKADLEAILKAYVHYNPIIGYTQGMGLLVGIFLLHMPAEDAFWLLCALLRDIHMEGYYSQEMKQMHIDGVILGQLLQTMDPELAGRLQELGVEPIHFTPNWFLPLFCRIVPWPTLLRIWDILFFEGPANWMLQTSLALLRIVREPLMSLRGPTASEDALRLLLHPPQQELTPENVLVCAQSVKLRDGEMRKLSRSASKLVRESQAAAGAARRRSSTAPNSAGGASSGSGAGSAAGASGPRAGGPARTDSVPARR